MSDAAIDFLRSYGGPSNRGNRSVREIRASIIECLKIADILTERLLAEYKHLSTGTIDYSECYIDLRTKHRRAP